MHGVWTVSWLGRWRVLYPRLCRDLGISPLVRSSSRRKGWRMSNRRLVVMPRPDVRRSTNCHSHLNPSHQTHPPIPPSPNSRSPHASDQTRYPLLTPSPTPTATGHTNIDGPLKAVAHRIHQKSPTESTVASHPAATHGLYPESSLVSLHGRRSARTIIGSGTQWSSCEL
jgi:hypothetical protein